MAGLPLLVITTVATREQALALARDLVERRLAACAQITAIDSVYRWQGAVEHDSEFRLLLKTHADGYAALEVGASANSTPTNCRRSTPSPPLQAYAPYAEWVEASTRPEPGAD